MRALAEKPLAVGHLEKTACLYATIRGVQAKNDLLLDTATVSKIVNDALCEQDDEDEEERVKRSTKGKERCERVREKKKLKRAEERASKEVNDSGEPASSQVTAALPHGETAETGDHSETPRKDSVGAASTCEDGDTGDAGGDKSPPAKRPRKGVAIHTSKMTPDKAA